MPRRSPVDVCMICQEVPCECNKKTKKTSTGSTGIVAPPATSTPVELTSSRPSSSAREKMKAAAAAPKPASTSVGKQRKISVPPPQSEHSDETVALHQAIRNLAPLLHPDELKRWGAVITAGATVAERAALWKGRRSG